MMIWFGKQVQSAGGLHPHAQPGLFRSAGSVSRDRMPDRVADDLALGVRVSAPCWLLSRS
jgi:hypothetical protein